MVETTKETEEPVARRPTAQQEDVQTNETIGPDVALVDVVLFVKIVEAAESEEVSIDAPFQARRAYKALGCDRSVSRRHTTRKCAAQTFNKSLLMLFSCWKHSQASRSK